MRYFNLFQTSDLIYFDTTQYSVAIVKGVFRTLSEPRGFLWK